MPSKKNNYLQNILSIFGNFVRVNKMIWQEKKWFIISMLLVFVSISSLPYIQSGTSALLINRLIEINNGSQLDKYVYYLVIVLIISYALNPIIFSTQTNMLQMFWFYLEKKFQVMVSRKLSSLDIAIHENPKYKDLISKIGEGAYYRLQNFIERQFFLTQSLTEVIIASSILVYSQWWIYLLIVLGTIPELINELRYGRRVWEIWSAKTEIRRRYFDLRWRFNQVPSLIEMKLFQNIDYFINIFENLFTTFQNEEINNEKKRYRFELFGILISQITFAIALVFFINLVIKGQMQVGTFTFMIASISGFRRSISNLLVGFARQYQDNLFVNDLFSLLDIKDFIQKPDQPYKVKNHATPRIEFKNVSFAYPETTKNVLKNFSLTIEPGEKIALVGINGAGKTTIIKLLCRFYEPTHGNIFIDGVDIKKIDLESFYQNLGAIFQDYERYHFLVKEVIALGRTGKKSSLEKVKDAARASEADVFIQEWDQKYSQMLGNEFSQGIEPSVGQWQKLALARTFYRDPRILILDEPTSSIDAEAEAKIFSKLHELPKDRTVILISHRFSTVRHADKICVIKNGKMSEYGTHHQLLKNNKVYARLFKLQAKGYQ